MQVGLKPSPASRQLLGGGREILGSIPLPENLLQRLPLSQCPFNLCGGIGVCLETRRHAVSSSLIDLSSERVNEGGSIADDRRGLGVLVADDAQLLVDLLELRLELLSFVLVGCGESGDYILLEAARQDASGTSRWSSLWVHLGQTENSMLASRRPADSMRARRSMSSATRRRSASYS